MEEFKIPEMSKKEKSTIMTESAIVSKFLLLLQKRHFVEGKVFELLDINSLTYDALKDFDIFNESSTQMMLYGLMLIPRELLSKSGDKDDSAKFEAFLKTFNPFLSEIAEKDKTFSTYPEDILPDGSISPDCYYFHIRNAVAHSRCHFYVDDETGVTCVDFYDSKEEEGDGENKQTDDCEKEADQRAQITMKAPNVTKMILRLTDFIETYRNYVNSLKDDPAEGKTN